MWLLYYCRNPNTVVRHFRRCKQVQLAPSIGEKKRNLKKKNNNNNVWKEQEGARCFKWRSDWPCRPFVSPGGRVHPLCAPRLPWASFRVNVPDSTDYLLWRLSTCLKNSTPPCLNSQVLLSELRAKASEASVKKKERKGWKWHSGWLTEN